MSSIKKDFGVSEIVGLVAGQNVQKIGQNYHGKLTAIMLVLFAICFPLPARYFR